jgi:hypothetical protein
MNRNYINRKLPLHNTILVRLPRNALSSGAVSRSLQLIKDKTDSEDASGEEPIRRRSSKMQKAGFDLERNRERKPIYVVCWRIGRFE